MTDPTRGVRPRRASRRPGGALLTALLVLAIVASSALVFTNSVELLKLAVIVALWAAVIAAFVSFIYRRQADVDSARARDLKLVYDLQLDREISARREYELGIEAQLRRELSSELRTQSADEVASLRAELAALRANLEIIFDTDLQHRPAIETERTSVHRFPDWDRLEEGRSNRERSSSPGRVVSSRIDTEDRDEPEPNTEESPIIDVPIEAPPEPEWISPDAGGAHRRASEAASARASEPVPPREPIAPPPPPPAARPAPMPEPVPAAEVRQPWIPAPPPPVSASAPPPRTPPPPTPAPPPPVAPPQQPPAARSPWQDPERPGRHTSSDDVVPPAPPPTPDWRPAPAEGEFIPAGVPGSNWVSPTVENGHAAPDPAVAENPDPTPPEPDPTPPEPVAVPPRPTAPPAMAPPSTETRSARHAGTAAEEAETSRRARHYAPGVDPGKGPNPTLATPPAPPQDEGRAARHRPPTDEPEQPDEPEGQHADGQPISELLARLQAGGTGGGRRRRREE